MTKARTNADNASADIQGVTAGTGLTGGGTSGTVALAIDSTVATLTGSQTLTNKTLNSPFIKAPYEVGQQLAAAGGAMNIDVLGGSFQFYTSTTTANFTLNFRGDSSTTLNSLIGIGQPITISIIVSNTTAYYPTAFTIDGSAPALIKWSGGTAPSAGNANSYDAYTFTIWKYSATPDYVMFAAGPIKYA